MLRSYTVYWKMRLLSLQMLYSSVQWCVFGGDVYASTFRIHMVLIQSFQWQNSSQSEALQHNLNAVE